MNAVTLDPPAVGQAGSDRPRLLGLRNLIRKDLSEWIHGKRPWIVLGVTTTVFVLAAANAWITDLGGPADSPPSPVTGPPRSCRCCRSTTCCPRSAPSSSSWR